MAPFAKIARTEDIDFEAVLDLSRANLRATSHKTSLYRALRAMSKTLAIEAFCLSWFSYRGILPFRLCIMFGALGDCYPLHQLARLRLNFGAVE